MVSRTRPGGLCALLLPVALFCQVVGAAELTATLDRDHIVAGETVTLVVQTDDPQQSLDADLSALERDFTVLDRRSETQMSIVNGRQSAVIRLLLTLEPRRSGALTIPALRFGSATTPERSLQVDPAPETQPGELPPVFIDVELEPAAGPHYVHAQLHLTVRVYYLPNLTEAAITPPEPAPAAVRLLDEVPYQAERGGTRYRVLERHYAVFPERSGPLLIPAMRLTGRLVERRADQLWQPAVRGRRIQASSEPLELDILPKPAGYAGGAWQPARSLEGAQNVSASETLKVGEPVTRTVIIDAVGLEENMIPEPAWPELPGTRIYPDQPQGITRDDGKWVLGHKEFRYAVVPEREGELVLPELSVPWWDTVNDRQATAVLPEVRLQVLPSALAAAATAVPVPGAGAALPEPPAAVAVPGGGGYWVWLTALFAALWLATLALYLRRHGLAIRDAARRAAAIPEHEAALLEQLQRACAQSAAAEARRALAQWLRRFGPARYGGSLRALAAEVGDRGLGAALLRLDAAGFEPGGDLPWQGEELWQRFGAWRSAAQREQRAAAEVTDLYASGTR
jgi:hypothetical protein